jgi:short subunit dehydrogenase-like uncharacterized protein
LNFTASITLADHLYFSTDSMPDLLIYGATGYTAQLACNHAKNIGADFIIAGRDENKLLALSSLLNVKFRVFNTVDNASLDSNLQDVRVMLNCAGPFSATAEALMRACIRNRVHYLDTSAELISYELAERLDQEARNADVLLFPGGGGSVAMFSYLSGYVLANTVHSDTVKSIEVALHVTGSMSRGSAISAAQGVTNGALQRVEGVLEENLIGGTAKFDFHNGSGEVDCFPVTLPDLITLSRSTKIPNISCYVHVSNTSFPTGDLSGLPDGPSQEERDERPYQAGVRITLKDGSQRSAVLHTVNGYTFIGIASVEAAHRILQGQVLAGFQTPVDLFGISFVESIAGSALSMV